MSKKSIFELAFVVVVSTIMLVIGLFAGAISQSDIITVLALYFINIIAAMMVSRLQINQKTVYQYYFSAFHLYVLAIVYLTDIGSSSVYIFGLIMLIAALLTLGVFYALLSFTVFSTALLVVAPTTEWLVTFELLYLFTFIYLVYLLQRFHNLNQAVNSKLSKAEVERERLISLINSMGDGVIATDGAGNVILYNGAALDILDTNQTLENTPLSEIMLMHDSNGDEVDLIKSATTQNGYLISRDFRLVVNEDEYVNLYIAISPVRLGYGNSADMIGYIVVLRDISKEKSLEEERDEFISVVSHELRTPITIAEGNISNLELILKKQKGEIDSDLNQAIEDAHKQVVFLADMINDLSTLSRADRGVLRVEPGEIDVKDLITSLVRDYTPDAQEKGLAFEYHADEDAKLFSSKLYVREVLQNFLTNAIKYTQEGSIILSAKKASGGVKFAVSDTGIGLSNSDQKKLFQKFFRSEDFRTRENNGTGLGLYVTLKLVKLLKAKIDVESKLNKGSTFSVFIPDFPQNQ